MGDVRVVLDDARIRLLAFLPGLTGAMIRAMGPQRTRAKARAPVSPNGNHGRPAGYLRDHITLRSGTDATSRYVDLISPAKAPDGYPYARTMEKRRPYLRPLVK